MPTARFSTEVWSEAGRSVAAVGPLLSFRAAGLRGRARTGAVIAMVSLLVITVLAAWLPGYLPEGDLTRGDVLLLLPTGYVTVLVVSLVSAAASGGGRELLPREQGVAFPVSPTTDHLGALLMAPLNIAWLLQSWTLLAATAFVVGVHPTLVLAQIPVLLWLATATALAQMVSWAVEWLRRGPNGRLVVRVLIVVLAGALAALISTGALVPLLDHSPTVKITLGVLEGAGAQWWRWLQVVVVELGIELAAVIVGAYVAGRVAKRPPRDELRVESSVQAPRDEPRSDLVALMRTDRMSIWRSVPLRRGLGVLALLPGLVALASDLDWSMLCIMPGLVCSGGALLFGVNSWSLDGRGALWRDSLPVDPKLTFFSRVAVLAEVLMFATVITLVLAALRTGVPSVSQLSAVVCCTVVVALQVVSGSLRWSVRRPFSVDLRSARATPAPPLTMVGYSARLALVTTTTGLLFGVTSHVSWEWSVLLALPFALFSAYRLTSTAASWADPVVRSKVVATVAS
ncbi:MAG TPA: hypothetical protein VFJ19_00765 [Nocardioidaceae bacterium]|nr:hypothetical protein [Nocardioidaceae bacterium]